MKLKALFSVALIGSMALVSCNSNDKGKALDEYSNLTEMDSISYLFGEMSSQNFWRMSVNDTTFKGDAARDAYLKGIEKAMELAEGKDKAYLQGLMQGLEIMQSLEPASKSLGADLNVPMILNGIRYGLSSDTVLNSGNAAADFQRLVSRVQKRKQEADNQIIMKALQEYAQKEKFNKVDSLLYEKVLAPGHGTELINAASEVECSIQFADTNGKPIEVPGYPTKIKVANMLGSPIGQALLKMKEGQTASFATAASQVFGQGATRFGLEPSDVLIMKISVAKVTDANLPTETVELKEVNK